MSGKRILAVFCFGLLIIGSFWEWNVYNHWNQKTEENKEKNREEHRVEDVLAENKRDFNLEQAVLHEDTEEKKIAYLTFDDGPSFLTEEVLMILEKEDIRATFFLIGSQITEEEEELLKQMAEKGHVLGVHTYSHKSGEIYRSAEAYIEDAKKTADRIYEVTGEQPNIYRFPWGSVNCYVTGICDTVIEKMKADGYEYFDWNVSAEDSVGTPTKDSIIKNIKKDYGKYKEPVILMHDSASNKATVEALPEIIQMLKEDGYGFGTLDEREKTCHYSRK